MDRAPCIDDPSVCRPGDCWCARWEGVQEPFSDYDDPGPEPGRPPRRTVDVPVKGNLL